MYRGAAVLNVITFIKKEETAAAIATRNGIAWKSVPNENTNKNECVALKSNGRRPPTHPHPLPLPLPPRVKSVPQAITIM